MTANLPSTPETRSPSRRALLAGALGGIGAWAAGAIGRASPVRAVGDDGSTITVGSTFLDVRTGTYLSDAFNSATVFSAVSSSASGGGGGIGLFGGSGSGSGVQGHSDSGDGVDGSSTAGYGVSGTSTSGYGVHGTSSSSLGVYGASGSSIAVYGESNGNSGVSGSSSSTSKAASVGWSIGSGNSTGVQGQSGGSLVAAKAKTGVYGYAAQDSSARGVIGETTIGHGLHGIATTGFAGYFAGKVYVSKFHEMAEISTPSAPAANKARLFARDNGSGKTQLCVRFPTGSVKVLATQT